MNNLESYKNINKLFSKVILIFVAGGLLIPTVAASASSATSAPFQDPNPSAQDYFGYSVSLSQDGNTAVVTAPQATYQGDSQAGAAYVFSHSTGNWIEVAQLDPTQTAVDYNFGVSSAITPDGTQIIVGANNSGGLPENGNPSNNLNGAAYIYTMPNGGWGGDSFNETPTTMLSGSDTQSGDEFGNSVALSSDGQTALVGAKYKGPLSQEGAAYIFQPTSSQGWGNGYQQSSLTGSDIGQQSQYGWSVALSSDGTRAFVSSPDIGDNGQNNNSNPDGTVYAYDQTNGSWFNASQPMAETSKLNSTNASTSSNEGFGLSLATTSDGNTLVVGAPNYSPSTSLTFAGAVYQFGYSAGSWSQTTQLTASDQQEYGGYGDSVAIAPDTSALIVGSPQYIVNSNFNVGHAYYYLPDGNNDGGWTMNGQPLSSGNDTAHQDYGYSVALVNNASEGNLVIGAPAVTNTQASAQNASKMPFGSVSANKKNTGVKATAYSYDFASPNITSISPTFQGEGGKVTVKGSNLANATVTLNGQSVSPIKNTASIITFNVPLTATSGNLVISNSVNANKYTTSFTVLGPTIKSIPKSASYGSVVTIKGSNMAGVTNVQVNGVNAQINQVQDNFVIITVPDSNSGVTTGTVTLSAPSGTAVSSKNLVID